MRTYSTLSEALTDLKRRGYSEDFNLRPHCVHCPARNLQWEPEHFTVDEFHRFEGMSSTDDNSIVYAISSKDGIKGTLVDAYGMYSSNLTEAMIHKLSIRR
ncbi:MAG TPA: phosphoribosylpyrophosphate synthetase [Chryseosolibacter sp.]|nr:phosphoribosylpyrophosphate synthetase [Chryseosolibacter sp.]